MYEAVITFCTSTQVTAELLHDLNSGSDSMSDAQPFFYNEFHPAELNPEQFPASSKERVDFDIGYFENVSTEQLQDFMERRYETLGHGDSSMFAVLDERSAHDRTVVVHSKEPIYDEETDDIVEYKWYSWRVDFRDAWILTIQLQFVTPQFTDEVLIGQASRFTDSDGVLDLTRARAETGWAAMRDETIYAAL